MWLIPGRTVANSVRVDFYWANPALQVTRSNATFVDRPSLIFRPVAPRMRSASFLQTAIDCERWARVPRGGREPCGRSAPEPPTGCFRSAHLPASGAEDLTVLSRGRHLQAAMLTITVSGLQQIGKFVILTSELGGELDANTLASLGLRGFRPAKEPAVEVGIDRERRCISNNDPIGTSKFKLHVPRGTSEAVYVTVRAKTLAK